MKTNRQFVYNHLFCCSCAYCSILACFCFQALRPQQDANVRLDHQKQILFALNQDRNMSDETAQKLWHQIIIADDIIDANGKVVKQGTQGGRRCRL